MTAFNLIFFELAQAVLKPVCTTPNYGFFRFKRRPALSRNTVIGWFSLDDRFEPLAEVHLVVGRCHAWNDRLELKLHYCRGAANGCCSKAERKANAGPPQQAKLLTHGLAFAS